jgi:hypothetical protein
MTLFHPWLNVPAPGFYNDSPEGDKIFISGRRDKDSAARAEEGRADELRVTCGGAQVV